MNKPSQKGYRRCAKCRTNLIKSNSGKKVCDECRRPKKEDDTREPNKDCPYWRVKSCDILAPAICREKECGFYPPIEAQRKAGMRARCL